MKLTLKNLLQTNCTLKIVSLLFGYFFWFMYSQSALIQIKRIIPICFYNTVDISWKAPETIQVLLQAKRSDFYQCALHDLALHINAQELKNETTMLIAQESQLFLPDTIKMIDCKPRKITVQPINQI